MPTDFYKKTLLAFDASSDNCTVALQHRKKLYQQQKHSSQEQSRHLLTMIDELLKQAAIHISDIDYIIVGKGPGSFTGIRLAISVAQGLALAGHKKIITLSSLFVLAHSAYRQSGQPDIHVALDARVKRVFYAHYQFTPDKVVAITDDRLMPADTLNRQIDLSQGYLVGNGWQACQDTLHCHNHLADLTILPGSLINLCQLIDPQPVSAEHALPCYLAEPNIHQNKKS